MWGNAARFGMMLCLVGCYPLNVKPMVAPCAGEEHDEHLELLASKTAPLLQKSGKSYGTRLPSCLIVASCTFLSMWATNLGSLNAINGAIQVIIYSGFIPGAAGLYLLGFVTPKEKVALWLLVAFATTMSVVGTFASDNNAEGMIKDCVLTM